MHESRYQLPQQQRRDEEESGGRFFARDEVVGISEEERWSKTRSQDTRRAATCRQIPRGNGRGVSPSRSGVDFDRGR